MQFTLWVTTVILTRLDRNRASNMRTTLAMLSALLLTSADSALAQTRYGTVFLNNYDSGKGIVWFSCPAPAGTRVEVFGGPTANSLALISFPGTSSYTIKEGDVNALGPGTGSFFDYGFGSVPGVLPGGTGTFLVRAWMGAASYDTALDRGSVTWTQATGTNPGPPELPQPAVLSIPITVWIGKLGSPVTV